MACSDVTKSTISQKFSDGFQKNFHGRCQIVVWEGLPSFTSIALFVFELSRIFGRGGVKRPPPVKRGLIESPAQIGGNNILEILPFFGNLKKWKFQIVKISYTFFFLRIEWYVEIRYLITWFRHLGLATWKCHLGLIRLRIFEMRLVSGCEWPFRTLATNLRQRNPKESVTSPISASGLGWQRVTNFKDTRSK